MKYTPYINKMKTILLKFNSCIRIAHLDSSPLKTLKGKNLAAGCTNTDPRHKIKRNNWIVHRHIKENCKVHRIIHIAMSAPRIFRWMLSCINCEADAVYLYIRFCRLLFSKLCEREKDKTYFDKTLALYRVRWQFTLDINSSKMSKIEWRKLCMFFFFNFHLWLDTIINILDC